MDIEDLIERLAAGELMFDDAIWSDAELLGIKLRRVSLRQRD